MSTIEDLLAALGLEDEAQIEYGKEILLAEGDEDDQDRQEAVLALLEEPTAEAEGDPGPFTSCLKAK